MPEGCSSPAGDEKTPQKRDSAGQGLWGRIFGADSVAKAGVVHSLGYGRFPNHFSIILAIGSMASLHNESHPRGGHHASGYEERDRPEQGRERPRTEWGCDGME